MIKSLLSFSYIKFLLYLYIIILNNNSTNSGKKNVCVVIRDKTGCIFSEKFENNK